MPALTHLDRLEAESIQIFRETVAEAAKPVMLYSIGKDSSVMLHLAKKAFSKIAKKGALSGKAFWAGTKAHDADDRIVYNKKTGALYYDDDGSGAHAMVQIAKLSKNLKLTAKDFFVV